jgi:cbb3-type cytochrome oxidase subunit 1
MSAIPADVDAGQQPPMTVPLRHFLVANCFLLLGVLAGLGVALDRPFGLLSLAHAHLLLVGWVCLTIMGAMTQFVPVWSGVELHSTRLAAAELWLVVAGLLGFAGSLLAGELILLPGFGALMSLGFWVFVYNVGRTLARKDELDVTERHFALALGFFVLTTLLGILLAVDFARPLLDSSPVTRQAVVQTHATVAVFGAVLTTVLGALYQLATMFTQTDLHGVDVPLRRVEELGYPVGVLLLASGRLFSTAALARIGAVLIIAALLAFTVILGRRLWKTGVNWTPMLSRYVVVTAALALWAVLALPAWLADPLAPTALFGAPGTSHLLLLGVIGFVVLGTLYHVVPFIVWVHRYSDLLGYEPVPMVDDLYDDRVAAADFACFVAGSVLLVAADLFGLPDVISTVGGGLTLLGTALFVTNIAGVVREHSPQSLTAVLVGGRAETQSD